MSTRTSRVEQMLRRALAELLVRGDLRDRRLRNIAGVSITGVKISPDLGSAQVYVDVLGGEVSTDDVIAGLNASSAVLRTRLGGMVRLKRTPSLRFSFDDSIERGNKIEAVLAQLRAEGELGGTTPAATSEPSDGEE